MKFDQDLYEQVDFSNQILDCTDLSRKKFRKCKFCSTDFTDLSMIYHCTFESCQFIDAKLNGVTIRESAFLSCNFKYAVFFATELEECKMTGSDFSDADCDYVQISGGDWSFTNLRGLEFTNQKLNSLRLTGSDLTDSKFIKCSLRNCELDDLITHHTYFSGSDLRGSSLENMDFTSVILKGAKVDLQQAVSIAENLTEVKYAAEKHVDR